MMKKLVTKPYILFWGIIPGIFMIDYYKVFYLSDNVTNDTTEIILRFELTGYFALFLLIIGMVYWVVIENYSFSLSFVLNIMHVLFTIGGIVLLQNYIEFDFFSTTDQHNNPLVECIFITSLLSQLFLILNILVSFFRNKNKIS